MTTVSAHNVPAGAPRLWCPPAVAVAACVASAATFAADLAVEAAADVGAKLRSRLVGGAR